MRGVDEPYQQWEKRPPFVTKDGRTVYPLYAPAYASHGSHIRVFDRDVDPADYEVEHSLLRHRVAFLDWHGRVVSHVETDPAWRQQGIARAMLAIARSEDIEPSLRHARCTQRSEYGERFVRGTDREQACEGNCGSAPNRECRDWASQIGMPGQEGVVTSVRPLGWRAKIKALIGF